MQLNDNGGRKEGINKNNTKEAAWCVSALGVCGTTWKPVGLLPRGRPAAPGKLRLPKTEIIICLFVVVVRDVAV